MNTVYRQSHITSSTTTSPIQKTCAIRQIIISCTNAGTGWTIKVQDRAGTPKIWVPAFTLTVPTDGKAVVISWKDDPAMFEGGVDIVTAGTAGVVDVAISALQGDL